MDERVKFITRLLDGEPMGLCEEFSISRKTGYKILKRAIVTAESRGSPTARAALIGTLTSSRCRSRR